MTGFTTHSVLDEPDMVTEPLSRHEPLHRQIWFAGENSYH